MQTHSARTTRRQGIDGPFDCGERTTRDRLRDSTFSRRRDLAMLRFVTSSRASWQDTVTPVGLCVSWTQFRTLLIFCPPGPLPWPSDCEKAFQAHGFATRWRVRSRLPPLRVTTHRKGMHARHWRAFPLVSAWSSWVAWDPTMRSYATATRPSVWSQKSFNASRQGHHHNLDLRQSRMCSPSSRVQSILCCIAGNSSHSQGIRSCDRPQIDQAQTVA